MLADIYQFGDATNVATRNGDPVVIGSVIEAGWKKLAYIFAVRHDDGSCISFDVREVPGLREGFVAYVSAVQAKRLTHLSGLIGSFETRDAFIAAISAVGTPMASSM